MYTPKPNDLVGRLIALLKTLDLDLQTHARYGRTFDQALEDYPDLEWLVNQTLVFSKERLNTKNIERVERLGILVCLNGDRLDLYFTEGRASFKIQDYRQPIRLERRSWHEKLLDS